MLPLGQAQEDGGGEGVETVEKLQNLEPTTNAGGQALGQAESQKVVYVIPVRDDIMPPILYVIRRGVKEAMEAEADCLIIDMETNGGRVDITEEIFGIIDKFKGETVTYVNRDAYSAGAFIAVSTDQIYMAPQSVIGAAAPLMMGPGGGASELEGSLGRDRFQIRTTSHPIGAEDFIRCRCHCCPLGLRGWIRVEVAVPVVSGGWVRH